MNPRIDHVLTFANVHSIDEFVERYRALGFVVSDETRPYKPELRNRFVQLGCEYLELVWVEREDEFARGGAEEFARMFADLPSLRQAARPFSIGFVAQDVEALHVQWARAGWSLPPVWSVAPPGMPPILSFQDIPDDLLPGASCFALTYHSTAPSPSHARKVQRAANTTYAVEGITFVSPAPADAARRWQALLNPDGAATATGDMYAVIVPPHQIWWVTPGVFQARYGVAWTAPSQRSGHIAAIHLLAEDLDVGVAMFGQRLQNRVQIANGDDVLVLSPTGEDGVTLIVREYPIERWQAERERATGETIVISR